MSLKLNEYLARDDRRKVSINWDYDLKLWSIEIETEKLMTSTYGNIIHQASSVVLTTLGLDVLDSDGYEYETDLFGESL